MDDETTLRHKTATLTRMLNHQGTIGMFGHVSVRVPGTDRILLSPGGGTDKSTVQPDEIFVFDLDGNIVHHPGGLIPLEWRIHTRIHRDRPECMCIAHLHARHATVLGIAGHDVVPVFLHGSFLHGGVPTWNNPRLVVNDAQAADSVTRARRQDRGADARPWQRRGRRERGSRLLRLHLPGRERRQAIGGRDHRRRDRAVRRRGPRLLRKHLQSSSLQVVVVVL